MEGLALLVRRRLVQIAACRSHKIQHRSACFGDGGVHRLPLPFDREGVVGQPALVLSIGAHVCSRKPVLKYGLRSRLVHRITRQTRRLARLVAFGEGSVVDEGWIVRNVRLVLGGAVKIVHGAGSRVQGPRFHLAHDRLRQLDAASLEALKLLEILIAYGAAVKRADKQGVRIVAHPCQKLRHAAAVALGCRQLLQGRSRAPC